MGLARWTDRRAKSGSRSAAQAAELVRAQPGGNWIGIPFRFCDREGIYRELDHPTINAAIDRAPIREVPIAGLRSIQHTVNRDRVEQYVRQPKMMRRGQKSASHGGLVDLPIVVRWNGDDLVYDGNHRTTAAMYRGDRTIQCRYVDLDALRNPGSARQPDGR